MNRGLVLVAGLALLACTEGTLGGSAGSSGAGAGLSTGNGTGGDINISTSGGSGCLDCVHHDTGVGTANPFDPDNNESDNVGTDPDGALVLDPANSNIPGIIWIANTNLGTVTKVDTTTFQILGRYQVGSVDPSRTSVNGLGDVFVGNRAGNSLTKVSAAGQDCPDTNGDNQITTSTGFNDVLPYGQDDCVIWDSQLPNSPHIRGVAAQDRILADPIPDDPDNTKIERSVWAGGTNHRTVYKYDADNGQLLIQTDSPSGVYGLALDGNDQLWISGRTDGSSNVLGRLDTAKCFDQNSCDGVEICERDCTNGTCLCKPGCSTSCDDAIKERIFMPTTLYGITVDFKQRVWMGGDNIMRYDPQAPEAQRYAAVKGTGFVHGLAADAKGSLWGATGGSVVRVDTEALTFISIPVAAKGMAIDKHGKVWAIEHGQNANVITPGSNMPNDFTTTPGAVTGLGTCYTYSDMTGLQLALATNHPGWYREVMNGCPGGGTNWHELVWDVELPPDTKVRFRARTADSVAALKLAEWVVLAKLPGFSQPVDIGKAFDAKMITMGAFLELEVELTGAVKSDELISPKVKSYGVTHQCPVVAN